MRAPLLLLALAGCPWIDAAELDRRLDADADGALAVDVGGADCDDADPEVGPGATERCNGLDDDCDGQIDEGLLATFHPDADGDGFGDPAQIVEACEAPAGHVADGTDCDDSDGDLTPTTPWYTDGDGDGHGTGLVVLGCSAPAGAVRAGDDCDDADASVHPGADETCAGGDADCDGLTGDDEPDVIDRATFYADGDGDDYGRDDTTTEACLPPEGFTAEAGDCDDNDPDEHPGARWYVDGDGDGHGGTVTVGACERPDGSYAEPTDCDDSRADVSPDATERCDAANTDEDCNGHADDDDVAPEGTTSWWPDDDNDGWGAGTPVQACDPPGWDWADRDGDCDDSDASLDPETPWYVDGDGDGHGDPTLPPVQQCEAPAASAADADDCDDTDATIHPGAPERCDLIDSDCDETLDDPEATGRTLWYADDDDDGWGDDRDDIEACVPPLGHVDRAGDCDDGDPAFHPEAPDACYDGIDHDCRDDDDDDCDDDGFVGEIAGGDDCDDLDPGIYPGVITERRVPDDHLTIQAAIDASCPGDLILLDPAVYTETLDVHKPVSILGAGMDDTVIDGLSSGPVVQAGAELVLEDLTVQNGAGDTAGCLFLDTPDPVEVRRVRIQACYGDDAGAVYGVDNHVILEEVIVSDAFGGSAPVYLVAAQPGSAIRDTTFTRLSADTVGGLMLASGEIDLDGLEFLDTDGGAVGAFASYGSGGTWTDLRIEQAVSIAHSAVSLDNVLGLPTPIVISGLEIVNPGGGFVSNGVHAQNMVDLEVHDLVIRGGPASPFDPPPVSLFVVTEGGVATLENVELRKIRGSVTLLTTTPSDRIELRHATLAFPEEGLVTSAWYGSDLVVSHTIVAGSRGDGVATYGSSVDHTVVWDSAGTDWLNAYDEGVDGNATVDPAFVAYGAFLGATALDLRLRPGSPLIDAGDPASTDPDGSPADIGALGGPGADPTAYDDLDGDGIYDSWEVRFGLDDPTLDADADGLDNLTEFLAGTLPTAADSDGDGTDDAAELLAGTDPMDASSP